MSASRPKSSKVIQKIPTVTPTPPPASTPTKSKSKSSSLGGLHKPPLSNGVKRPIPSHLREVVTPVKAAKGKGREVPSSPAPSSRPASVQSEDEDDDFEEVPIPGSAGPSSPYPGTPTTPGTNLTAGTTPGTMTTAPSIDDDFGNGSGEEGESDEEAEDDGVIHLEIGGETAEEKAKRIAMALRKKPITSKDRAIRLEAHKIHVIALLASVRIRNKWCSNNLLKARLLSLLPHPLQSAFNIPPSRFPDRAQRSRLFFDALQSLVTWWSQSFFDISDSTLGLRTRPWDEVQEIVDQLPRLTRADFTPNHFVVKEKGKGKCKQDAEWMDKLEQGSGGERLRSVNSLMKKALQQEGSRDVSAQLFVALARACGLGVRLVCSLQAVPWRAEKVAQKKKPGAGRGGRTLASRQGNGPTTDEEDEDEDEMEEVPIPAQGSDSPKERKNNVRAAGTRRLQDPADLYRLRKVKPPPQKVGTSKPKIKTKQDLSEQPPVFWAEVFSRSDQRWIPVDPVQGTIRKKTHYEPTSDSGPIRMLYVVAFEEDGFARDVTLRYTKNFGAKTIKLRVPQKKDEPDWWESVLQFLQRPYRLNRDELEDAELEMSQVSEGMPMHMNGFKDHPIYVLERHLKREEVIQPKREIGRFKGEPVYRRANVQSCKTAENWMRVGRRVRDRQEPLKWVKQRAVTLQKRRAQELAVQEGQEPIQQGLYAQWQTEVYIPPPIKDGVIPQNSFGNLDLYAPTMLPAGAVHLSYKGIAKVAKNLGISYAEACTGFEFKKQRAIPVITGIVVAAENEALTMDAYMESTAVAEEKARIKAEERALKRWVKLINGLRVRKRLQAEYGQGEELHENQVNPLADPITASEPTNRVSTGKKSAAAVIASAHEQGTSTWTDKHRERSISVDVDSDEEGDVETTEVIPDDGPAAIGPAEKEETTLSTTTKVAEHDVIMDVDDDSADDEEIPANSSLSDIEMITPPPPSRPTKLTLRLKANGANGQSQSKAEKPKPSRSTKNVKRKAEESPDLSDLSDFHQAEIVHDKEEERVEEPKPKRARATKAKPAFNVKIKAVPPPAAVAHTRSLRSRAPKNAEQEREEAEKRERMRRALNDDCTEDEDEDEEGEVVEMA